jgi:hypothetical protein
VRRHLSLPSASVLTFLTFKNPLYVVIDFIHAAREDISADTVNKCWNNPLDAAEPNFEHFPKMGGVVKHVILLKNRSEVKTSMILKKKLGEIMNAEADEHTDGGLN